MRTPDTPPPTRSRLPLIVTACVALSLGVFVALTTGNRETGEATASTALEPIQSALTNTLVLPDNFASIPGFSLLDGNNETITDAVFDDRWSMVFFGFTHCPDVCPITLSVMKRVIDTLESESDYALQVLFVTVDPNRDTPEVMGRYVDYFSPEFVGITGSQTDIQALTSALGIVASFSANDDNPDNYTVDHTASMLLVDPRGRVRAKFNAPHEVDAIVADYRVLRDALDG